VRPAPLRKQPLRRFARRLPPPDVPFSEEYHKRHRALVTEVLDSPDMIDRFSRPRRLPRGYGVGLDERVVEYPWLLAQRPSGKVLDAGSSLNHAHILDRFTPTFTSLHVVTLAPEGVSYPERGVSYVYADLRDLPFRDRYYDTVISVSTLEHVGMDNARYGVASSADEDPTQALREVVDELRRVLAPGGLFLATVPYGVEEDHGWFRQFDRAIVDKLADAMDPRELTVTVYEYSRRGWQTSSLAAAASARYQDSTIDKRATNDLAVAARAVVCLRARL
jgi:SAM-dependent methyltransferase